MEKRLKFFFLLVTTLICMVILALTSQKEQKSFPAPHPVGSFCPHQTSVHTITPLNATQHLLVSAYMDQREQSGGVRIIAIFRRDSVQPLYCYFCCIEHWSSGIPARIIQHSDHFGFPFVTTDVVCQIPSTCSATHVTLSPLANDKHLVQHTYLPISNQRTGERQGNYFQFNFTVCISSLFGEYNNVLQFTQTLEMYRLLGIGRVAIYNTSCGPELDRVLRSYSEEGFVEMVPWPIDHHLSPSRGWLHSEHGGDLHYFGQLTTLNECIYRYMDRSRYVLLNDIDEIIMPYQHSSLTKLMDTLQQEQPQAGVFLIENHIFPKQHTEPTGKFHRPQWEGVPGVNILEHIYREEPDRKVFHPHKMIVRPRAVEQTSVHSVLKSYGQTFRVPPEVCRIIHVRTALQPQLTLEQLHPDTRLWDFHDKLVPKVDKALRRVGLLAQTDKQINGEED